MKKMSGIAAAALLALSLVYLFAGGSAQPTVAAQGAHVIGRTTSPREPVRITRVQVGDGEVTFGNAFAADDEWVNALSVEVKNTSGKALTELRMSLMFDADGERARRVAVPLEHVGRVQPNETVRVTPPNASLGALRSALARNGQSVNFSRADLRLQLAKFADGSIWVKGVTLGPKDPQTGRRQRLKV